MNRNKSMGGTAPQLPSFVVSPISLAYEDYCMNRSTKLKHIVVVWIKID